MASSNRSSSEQRTLHGVLSEQGRLLKNHLAYTFQGNRGDLAMTFGQLDQRARAVATTIQETVSPGDRVMLLFPAGLDFISSFFGCLYAGALAVPTMYPKPRRAMPRLSSIARDCEASAILTDQDTLQTVDRSLPELKRLRWIAVDEISNEAADHLQPVDVRSHGLAFLQYTSGSTSEPKGVMVSHGNLLHNLEMIRQGFGLEFYRGEGQPQSGVFWLPAYHDMGLIGGILESMYVGGHSVLMSPAAFLQRPMGWLEAMSEHRATISGAPNFAYEFCVARSTDDQRRDLDLSPWKVAFCGAEPIRAETLSRFADAFAVAGFRRETFYPCFGLAEGTLLAAGNLGPGRVDVRTVQRDALQQHRVVDALPPADPSEIQQLVACGQALMGQEIVIVDPETCHRCPESSVGEIWLQGPSVAQGYWQRPEETRETFDSRLADHPQKPYLRTGDLGFMADGRLYVTGRLKDMMIIRGRNYYPQDIEQTVGDAHEALRPDAGAVFSAVVDGQEQLVIVQEIDRQYRDGNFDEIIRAIRRDVSQQHELDVAAVILIRHASLPRTTSGKVQRHICREDFERNQLKVLAQWQRARRAVGEPCDQPDMAIAATREDGPQRLTRPDHTMSPQEIARLAERVEQWLLTWLVERAAIPAEEVHRDKPFAEYGLDSMTAVEMSQELEDWLGVDVLPTVAWNYPTPATLSHYLARARAGTEEESLGRGAIPLDEQFAQMLTEVEGLSDDQVQQLLQSHH